jgi:uncharacterized protein with HEPN domain
MPHDPEKYYFDMLDRASFLVGLLHGKRPEELEADRILRSAVECEFSIIGEALLQLHRKHPEAAERITIGNTSSAFGTSSCIATAC